jgi:hypothetical protein
MASKLMIGAGVAILVYLAVGGRPCAVAKPACPPG